MPLVSALLACKKEFASCKAPSKCPPARSVHQSSPPSPLPSARSPSPPRRCRGASLARPGRRPHPAVVGHRCRGVSLARPGRRPHLALDFAYLAHAFRSGLPIRRYVAARFSLAHLSLFPLGGGGF